VIRALLTTFALLSALAQAGVAQTDRHGRIQSLNMDGDAIAIRTDVRIPRAGWSRLPSMADARDVQRSHAGGARSWAGTIEVEPGKPYRYEQTLTERDGQVQLALLVTALADVKTEGVYLWLDFPVDLFGGGTAEFTEGEASRSTPLPRKRMRNRHLLASRAARLVISGPTGKPRL